MKIPAILILLFLLPVVPALSDDYSLVVATNATGSKVLVQIRNTGNRDLTGLKVRLELAGKTYENLVRKALLSGKEVYVPFDVSSPSKEGNYPLITKVFYSHDGKVFSLPTAGYFHFSGPPGGGPSTGPENEIPAGCELDTSVLMEKGTIFARVPEGAYSFRLILPDEVNAESVSTTGGVKTYLVSNANYGFRFQTPFYGLVETPDSAPGFHGTSICEGRLVSRSSPRSFFTAGNYLLVGLLAIVFVYLVLRKVSAEGPSPSRTAVTVIRWSFSIAVISGLFAAAHVLYLVPNLLTEHHYFGLHEKGWQAPLLTVLRSLSESLYFDSGNYGNFFRYAADPLYIYFLTLNFPVLYFLVRPRPSHDKYWHLMLAVFSLMPGQKNRDGTPDFRLARTAFLSLCVKAFFAPLLTSWTISNFQHFFYIFGHFSGSFDNLEHLIIHSLISIDVIIFGVGYLTELPQLKNEIKSVEPTILGWAVCLACYPPFNEVSFLPFEYPSSADWHPQLGTLGYMAAHVAVILLWTIYVWATVALGFKSSNLTNRGIVTSGPYRFIRHPAYISKVLLWFIEGVVMAKLSFGYLAAAAIIYFLRAWTEERHLSADPAYVEYRKKVRWRFVPGVV